ncbi:Protein of unknown function [Gryllus bimaculatus]|nr:Protein of unknown function [Gryllus bimaculatus]
MMSYKYGTSVQKCNMHYKNSRQIEEETEEIAVTTGRGVEESRGVRRAWPECSHHRHDCIPPTSHNLPALAAAAAAAFAAVSQTNTSVPRGSSSPERV